MLPSKALLSVLISLTLFSSVLGNPITRRQYSVLKKRLEQSADEQLNSDDKTKTSDVLIQEKYEEKNMTYYRGSDKSLPVFMSYGLNNIAKKIHVLFRGEDYLNPQDEHTFIVLRQTSDPTQYSIHSAYVENLTDIANSAINWFSNLVEQKKNVKPLLSMMGNEEVQARSLRASRPLCDWLGFLLLCDTPKDVPPLKPIARETDDMTEDEEDTGAIIPWMEGGSEEQEDPAPAPKAKRQLPANSGPSSVSIPKSGGSSSGSKSSPRVTPSPAKSKIQAKVEAAKAAVVDNNLGSGKADDEEKSVAKEDEEIPPAASKGQEGRSFGSYDPKKQNEESNKKKHKRKHRNRHNRD